jgi:uncharacterized protein YeaO (DUF488 family)
MDAEIVVGRIYDPAPAGATRVLVDRLWPRGVRKEAAPFDLWLKDVAPSSELRTWYHAHPAQSATFAARYRAELAAQAAAVAALERLVQLARAGPVALLTAGRDVARSQAPVLRDVLVERLTRPDRGGA